MFNEKRFVADGNGGDSGGAWPDALELRTTAGDSCGTPTDGWLQYPEIATNDAGDAFVVWMEQRPDDVTEGGADLGGHLIAGRYRNSSCGGWGPVERISTDAAMHATLPHVALSDTGDAVIVWREVACANAECDGEESNGRVAARTRTREGVYSTNTLHLSEPDVDGFAAIPHVRRSNVAFLPSPSAGGADAVVVWHGHGSSSVGGGVYTVYSSLITSTTAAASSAVTLSHATTAISAAGEICKLPSLTVSDDGTGSFAVAWQRDDGVNSRAEVRTYSGPAGEWSAAPVTVSEAGSAAFWATPTSDGDGK